ncbi:hypothetical protein N7524_011858 [Penicillium chrysogenum]|nr:hypothetical protein N7524_011858 [Penicillium chrysogenum]
MNPPNQIIDPDGEVIIILRNADCPFAQPFENTSTGKASDIPLEIHNGLRSTVPLFKFSTFRFELPEQSQPPPEEKSVNSKEKRKKRKKEGKYEEAQTALEEYAAEEPAVEESAAVEPTAEEPTPEEPTAVEPAAEESATEESADEPAVDEFAAEESVAEFGTLKYLRIQKGSVEITAESWDTEAFLILLRAIHGQYYYLPRKLTLEMLAKVAVIADYYACKTALYIMKDIWIDNLEENIPPTVSRNLILWLWIAWSFQLHSQFKRSTLIAMSRSDDCVVSFGLPIPANVIGESGSFLKAFHP